VSQAKYRAEELLIHYMRHAWRAAGLDWDPDNSSEMGVLLDAIQDMVRDEIRVHAENAPHHSAGGAP
jgi:hypothetical protein